MKAKFLVLVALVLGLASCQNDPEGFDVTVNGEVSTKVTVNLADASGTRAGGSNLSGIENGALDGDNTLRYILQVFDETGGQSKDKMYAYTDERTAAFDVRLVPGRTYNFVVWADVVKPDDNGNYNDWHYNTTDLKNITLNGDWAAMDETRDAYTDVETINNFNSTSSINLTLTRPFAKLRVVTTDMDELMANVQPSKVQVEYTTDYRNAFNALAGAVVENAYSTTPKTHSKTEIVSYNEIGNNKTLFTDYLFAANSDDVVSFILKAYDTNDVLMRETNFNTDIPVKRNFLTTITGNVLTDGNNVKVTVDDNFGENNQNQIERDVWDGKSIEKPAYDANTKTYTITNGAQLAWIAAAVNGTLEDSASTTGTRATIAPKSFIGETIKLADDINLNFQNWTPIGTPSAYSACFKGTFDGDGHKVTNLCVYNKKGAGLFGGVTGGTIKNLTVDNVRLNTNHYAGAIIAWIESGADTVDVENCAVKNAEVVVAAEEVNGEWDNGDKGAGLIGFAHVANISDCSVENVKVKAYRDFAGLVGYAYKVNINGCETKDVELEQDLTHDYKAPNTPTTFGKVIGRIAEGNKVDGNEVLANGVYYNEEEEEYLIEDAGFEWLVDAVANDDFEGKTVKLTEDIDLFKGYMDDGDPISTAPIGQRDYITKANGGKHKAFKGTFDGQGHTIKNLYQNGWALGYWSGQYGAVGLFSRVENATIKNIVIDNCEIIVEGGNVSAIAANAAGECTFENITVKNSQLASYNNGVGGIVAWSEAGVYNFNDIKIESDVTLTGLWGTYDATIGGVLAEAEPGATYNFNNVEVNCKIDAFNDVISSYQWYSYRMCGMVVGRCEEYTTINGTNYPDLSKYNFTFNNVVVNYGDWMNYHYCVIGRKNGWRIEPGYSYSGLPSDADHSTHAECCNQCIPFDQLIGGPQSGQHAGYYGLREVDGITVNYPASYRREVSSAAALTEALGKGLSVVLESDIDFGSTQLAITGENQVVDLGGNALTTANNWGGISLKNGATIKNGTITHTGNTAAIKAFNGSSIENVTINATCSTADKTVTGIAVQQGANVESIKNVTITGVSQGIEVGYQATVGLIENAVVNESNNGTAKGIALVINGGKVGQAKDCTFIGETYGITLHLKGVFAAGLDLENCEVKGNTHDLYAWDEKGISNTSGSLVLTYDDATEQKSGTGFIFADFEEECESVVTIDKK